MRRPLLLLASPALAPGPCFAVCFSLLRSFHLFTNRRIHRSPAWESGPARPRFSLVCFSRNPPQAALIAGRSATALFTQRECRVLSIRERERTVHFCTMPSGSITILPIFSPRLPLLSYPGPLCSICSLTGKKQRLPQNSWASLCSRPTCTCGGVVVWLTTQQSTRL